MKHSFGWAIMGVLLLSLPAGAVNVQHFKKRIQKATQRPEQVFAQTAQAMACKKLKKPICYTHAISMTDRFRLAHIRRPQSKDLFMLFEKKGAHWKLQQAGLFTALSPVALTLKTEISQASAKGLIQNLSDLR